jgi:hypothetical protein
MDKDWVSFREQLRSALNAFVGGDAEPYQRCWTENDDCTVFGAALCGGPRRFGFASAGLPLR